MKPIRSTAPGIMAPERARSPLARLFLLAVASVLVQGYHFGVDDAAIYIPAVNKVFDPRLYPYGAEFFLSHARLSLFAWVIGSSARLLGLSVPVAVLAWHVGCLFLLLFASWQLASTFFPPTHARWGAVALVAALLPVPVAGTALFLADNYLSARSFSTPLALLSIGALIRGRVRTAVLLLIATALFHPQMAVYCAALEVVIWWSDHRSQLSLRKILTHQPAFISGACTGLAVLRWPSMLRSFRVGPLQGTYRDLVLSRTYFFAGLWHWYEWVGVAAPLVMLAIAGYVSQPRWPAVVTRICRSLIALGAVATGVFLIISCNRHMESATRLQPMRAFHLIYLLLFLLLGGLLGEHVLGSRAARWAALFVPLALGMIALDRSTYPSSPHLEMPWQTTSNGWLEAFRWVRTETPTDAVFALDPRYTQLSREDNHGFRALAERSVLADLLKDSGAVTMFPALLPEWEAQQRLQEGWEHFGSADFDRLARTSPVRWVIVQRPQEKDLACPYRNAEVAVCRIGGEAGAL